MLLFVPLSAHAVTYQVDIQNFAYNPGGMHIHVGDAIEWTNLDGVMHSATSDNGVWDSGLLAQNESYTYTFSLEGDYPYHCSLHSFMMDTIVVSNVTGISDLPSALPDRFEMAQNYPNPFNAETAIEYALPSDSHVRIDIYNLLGQNIETLVDDTRPAGYHQVVWNASDVPTGVYFYRIVAGNYMQTRKMLLVK